MTPILAWLRAPFGVAWWRWAVAAGLAALAVLVFRSWASAGWGLLGFARLPRRAVTYETPEDAARARDALRGHETAQATDRALSGVAAESAVREAAGATAAAEDDIDTVRQRVEARARGGKP